MDNSAVRVVSRVNQGVSTGGESMRAVGVEPLPARGRTGVYISGRRAAYTSIVALEQEMAVAEAQRASSRVGV